MLGIGVFVSLFTAITATRVYMFTIFPKRFVKLSWLSGLPKSIKISSVEIREAMMNSIELISESVKDAIEETPPELLADIMRKGIILAGGGALLRGLDRVIAEQTRMPTFLADDPLTCVARGTGIILEDIDNLKEVLVTTQSEQTPK